MLLKIDPAILKSLSLDPATTTMAPCGSSGFTSTFKLVHRPNCGGEQREKVYFVKIAKGTRAGVMFEGEHMSLNTIHNIVPSLCPQSNSHGSLASSSGSFLITDFLDLNSSPSSSQKGPGSGLSLAQKLAKLHTTPAPIPEGYERSMYGFPVVTCCGDTEQDNSYKSSWAEFFGECRLRGVLRAGEKRNGSDSELYNLVEKTVSTVVPALLRDGHLKDSKTEGNVKPVVVHGDLWNGNHGRGSIDRGPVEEVIFDPSASYSHSEFEFGIMKMFGLFGSAFDRVYFEAKEALGSGGKDEPVREWEDRVKLYELYHHLNHYSIFGGGYKGGAISIMKSLIKKYGDFEPGVEI